MTPGFYPEDFTVITRDFRNFKSVAPNFYITRNGEKIDLPAGDESDLASTPKLVWEVVPPSGWYARAAWLHDILYRYSQRPKSECDALLLEAMQVLLSQFQDGEIRRLEREAEARMFYEVVTFGGGCSFEADRKAQGGLNA